MGGFVSGAGEQGDEEMGARVESCLLCCGKHRWGREQQEVLFFYSLSPGLCILLCAGDCLGFEKRAGAV